MKKVFPIIALPFLILFLSYPALLQASNGQIMFVAKLNTDNEIPVVRGDALGLVTFLISEDRKEILIHGVFNNLTGVAIGCHIHQGIDTTGPVLVDLTSYVIGDRIKANLPLPDGLLQLALKGQLYLNVHTSSHPDGEIRGQLVWKAEYLVPLTGSGSKLVPPDSTSNAYALGSLRFSQNLTRMQYQIMPIGLSGPVTSAQIHSGVPGKNGALIASLNGFELISGTIEDTSLVFGIFTQVLFEAAYITINTAANPSGEIRSDLSFYFGNNGTAILNGDQEVPPVTTANFAYGYAAINPNLDSISYQLVYSGITPISAHIHKASAGVEGPAIISLESLVPGIYSGIVALTDDDLTSFLKDELYFNIHSTANPNGEIRGQIENNLMNSFAFDLCGDQENPKKTLNGYGAAYVAINKANTELDYGIITDGINGDATSTRLYDAVFGSNGPTLLNLDLPSPYVSKAVPIAGTVVTKLNADRGYINLHTAANPSGEIRGQVRRSLSCKINAANHETESQTISLFQNYTDQSLVLETDFDRTMNAQLVITDLTGHSILNWNTSFSSGTTKTSYNVGLLSTGFYVLNVMQENKIIRTFKFIIF